MVFTCGIAALTTILAITSAQSAYPPGIWSPTDPVITIQNTSPSDICYKVQFTSGNFQTTTSCDSSPGFIVSAGQTMIIHPGADFNGAITAILNNNSIKGARHELNFASPLYDMTGTWYDVDYQLGMSDSTLGPADGQPRNINDQQLPSLSGESNTLAKASTAWPQTSNQAQLLAFPNYIQQGSNGQLTFVYMDTNAPAEVAEFFQLTANFTAYCGPGSVAGVAVPTGTVQSEMVVAANEKSWWVGTQDMLIIAY